MQNVEIERKFLIDEFPHDLPLLEQATVWQGYICSAPVVRIRKKETAEGVSYRLCFKSKGTLVRREVEQDISSEKFNALSELLEVPLIRKDFKVFSLPDGHRLECNLVDKGTPTSFYYAEVEFPSVEEANAFVVPAFLGEEKTEDPAFTMSRYWERKKKLAAETTVDHVSKAKELFLEGFNCAQAVAGAFCEELSLSLDDVMKLSSSFGGGMGRMREVCGACSGMFMVAGKLYGYDTPETGEPKAVHYERIREMAEKFREDNGSIICREILGSEATIGGAPSQRTEKFYTERPCVRCVCSAAAILEEYMDAWKHQAI